jgi:DNA-directed RNA polymerase subunit F
MALRKETAAALEKKITWDAPNKFETLRQALEVVSYEKTPERMGPLAKLADAYLEELAKLDAEALKNKKGEIITLRNDTNVLIRNGVFADTCKLRAGLQKIIAEQGFEKKR